MFVLDTDHVSLLERGAASREALRLRARLEAIGVEEYATTVISYEEQTRGWLAFVSRARTLVHQVNAYRKLNRHLDIYRPMQVLDFDERSAAEFQRLRQARIRVGTMDLKIAAIVLAHDAILRSRNLVDFRRITGLKVEDWTVPQDSSA